MNDFNTMNLTPDDPRLTAYALGELEGDEFLAVESAVAADPELRQAVTEIRGTAEELASAFAAEPAPPITPIAIERYRPQPRVVRFPYWVAGGLVAASFAILLVLVRAPQPPDNTEEFHFVRVDTSPASRPVSPAQEGDSPAAHSANAPASEDRAAGGRSFDEFDPGRALAELESAELTFSASSQSLLAAASEAARRTPATETARSRNSLEPALSLPSPPQIDPSRDRPSSLLTDRADGATAFDTEFAVRTPMEEMLESGSSTLDSRRLFTSDPDVTSNLATVSETRVAEVNATSRNNAVFVYEPNRQNVRLRSMLREQGAAPRVPASNPSEAAAPVPTLIPEPQAREPTPQESLRNLIGETVQIAVGFRIPQAEANDESRAIGDDIAAYDQVEDNPFLSAQAFPLSTLPIDVDSAGYTHVRRFLASNQRPPRGVVRIEEMINYFDYDYAEAAANSDAVFATAFEVADAPWSRDHRLVRVALQAREHPAAKRPAANLVFLIDVSGSMDTPQKLPLIRQSLRVAVDRLGPADRVALVVFSTRAAVALPSTPLSDRASIERAIENLDAGAMEGQESGLALAYQVAAANFVADGINRVVLATDGDWHNEDSSRDELANLIVRNQRAGIALTFLGFGVSHETRQPGGNFLPDGLATVAYVDSPREARGAMAGPALVGDAGAAQDVRVQVEFNPARVQAYRLIGYENSRLPQAQSSAGETVVADVAPGHAITALYEVVPVGVPWNPPVSMSDRWVEMQRNRTSAHPAPDFGELLTVKMRYTNPAGATSELVEHPVFDDMRSFASSSPDFKFASAVAAFGMVMRDSPHRGAVSWDQIATWAKQGIGADHGGYRSEFLGLMSTARSIYVR